MASRENEVWKSCLLRLARIRPFARVFRNNVGQAWTGASFVLKRGQVYRAEGGERVFNDPRPVEFGLCKGSGDGIGFDSIVITPEMVGRRIAVFLSLETKGKGKATKEQLNWQEQVRQAGGIALIVNDADQLNLELP